MNNDAAIAFHRICHSHDPHDAALCAYIRGLEAAFLKTGDTVRELEAERDAARQWAALWKLAAKYYRHLAGRSDKRMANDA